MRTTIASTTMPARCRPALGPAMLAVREDSQIKQLVRKVFFYDMSPQQNHRAPMAALFSRCHSSSPDKQTKNMAVWLQQH